MPKPDYWTPEMYDRLRTLYPVHTNKQLEKLTGWCVKELQYRAGRIGLKKDKEAHKKALSKIANPEHIDKFITKNFDQYSNKELATMLGCSIGHVRARCYAMGMLRMTLEYWTEEQINFLIENYQVIGDKELAEIFNNMWSKEKGWTFKHIEKKRLYLKLKRSKEELHQIYLRNLENGRWLNNEIQNRWDHSNLAKDGCIRLWKMSGGKQIPVIKVNGEWRHWAPYAWELEHGAIPEGHIVAYIGDPSIIDVSNLELTTRSDLSRRIGIKNNGQLTDNGVAAMLARKDEALRLALRENKPLLELKRQQILLQRSIKQVSDGK
jgi:hypothetical protein